MIDMSIVIISSLPQIKCSIVFPHIILGTFICFSFAVLMLSSVLSGVPISSCPLSHLGTTFNPILSAIISAADCVLRAGRRPTTVPVLSMPVMLALVRLFPVPVPAFWFILIESAETSPSVKQEGSIMQTVHVKNTSAREMAFTMWRNDIVRITGKTLPPLETALGCVGMVLVWAKRKRRWARNEPMMTIVRCLVDGWRNYSKIICYFDVNSKFGGRHSASVCPFSHWWCSRKCLHVNTGQTTSEAKWVLKIMIQ